MLLIQGCEEEGGHAFEYLLITSLQILKYAKHIVKYVVIPKDPFRRVRAPLRPHRLDDWIFLEWMQNGTLGTFLERVSEANVTTLPNRLLWRLFFCCRFSVFIVQRVIEAAKI